MALYHNKWYQLDRIAKELQNDTTQIETISGCIIKKYSVADLVTHINYFYAEEKTNEYLTYFRSNGKFKMETFINIISTP